MNENTSIPSPEDENSQEKTSIDDFIAFIMDSDELTTSSDMVGEDRTRETSPIELAQDSQIFQTYKANLDAQNYLNDLLNKCQSLSACYSAIERQIVSISDHPDAIDKNAALRLRNLTTAYKKPLEYIDIQKDFEKEEHLLEISREKSEKEEKARKAQRAISEFLSLGTQTFSKDTGFQSFDINKQEEKEGFYLTRDKKRKLSYQPSEYQHVDVSKWFPPFLVNRWTGKSPSLPPFLPRKEISFRDYSDIGLGRGVFPKAFRDLAFDNDTLMEIQREYLSIVYVDSDQKFPLKLTPKEEDLLMNTVKLECLRAVGGNNNFEAMGNQINSDQNIYEVIVNTRFTIKDWRRISKNFINSSWIRVMMHWYTYLRHHCRYIPKPISEKTADPRDATEAAFSLDEDNQLKNLVDVFGKNQWNEISTEFRDPLKTPSILKSRYAELCSHQKKGDWDQEEDNRILCAVNFYKKLYGEKEKIKWSELHHLLPNRSSSQCRNRYVYVLSSKDEKLDESARETIRVLLKNFLRTGELSLNDKIFDSEENSYLPTDQIEKLRQVRMMKTSAAEKHRETNLILSEILQNIKWSDVRDKFFEGKSDKKIRNGFRSELRKILLHRLS